MEAETGAWESPKTREREHDRDEERQLAPQDVGEVDLGRGHAADEDDRSGRMRDRRDDGRSARRSKPSSR
jgi:hypothetical protein